MNKKYSQGYVKLEQLKISKNRIDYYFTVSDNLQKYIGKENHMFVEYDEEIESLPQSILVIPFVANIMPLMWITNSVLWIEEIDRNYYDSLYRIRQAYQDMYFDYKLKGVLVSAKTIYNEYEKETDALALFSGGLDAISTCIRIGDKKPILTNVYGWYKQKIEENDIFESDKSNIQKFSMNNDLQSKFIKSNFATITKSNIIDKDYKKKLGDTWWHGFQHGMNFIAHAIPLAYKYKVENIYIASTFPLGENRKSCASDPVVDIQTKYASGGVIHDGCEINRQDKIKLVVDKQKRVNKKYPLRVCSFNDKNCCKCEKCMRTILGLIAQGVSREELKKFDFNIEEELIDFYKNLMDEKIHLMGIQKEYDCYWPDIKKAMYKNKDIIVEKEFIEWFLEYDFINVRKKAVFNYRVKNFIPIMKRKILGSKYES